MGWATAEAARADLRVHLSDGETDKQHYRKKLLGDVNGTNKVFKTFERRRFTNFSTAAAPLGIYVNGTIATVTSDSPAIGEVTLTTAPAVNADVSATYYAKWFDDAELDKFLSNAMDFLQGGSVTSVNDGLKPAALAFAAADAYQKLANWWAETLSSGYRLEDAPNNATRTPAEIYLGMATRFRKEATDLRNAFYTRNGKPLQPLFATIQGRIKNPVPQR